MKKFVKNLFVAAFAMLAMMLFTDSGFATWCDYTLWTNASIVVYIGITGVIMWVGGIVYRKAMHAMIEFIRDSVKVSE